MESPVQGEIGDPAETTNYRQDVAMNEVIEAESSGEENRLVEVETVPPEDLFDFCMDQIVNASTRAERQEARDLLVDNFGEASLCEHDLLDVTVDNQIESTIIDTEQPSTSQISHNSTQAKPNQKKEELKVNPAKYQKALQYMRDYYKKRLEQMTAEEKKAFRQRKNETCRKYYHNLSGEKKRDIKRKSYQQQKSAASDKHKCKFPGCGKSFVWDAALIQHERIHLNIKPFSCTWPDCKFAGKQRSSVIVHVRTQHFKLPETKKAQQLANIIDNRNPNDYVQVNDQLIERRPEGSSSSILNI